MTRSIDAEILGQFRRGMHGHRSPVLSPSAVGSRSLHLATTLDSENLASEASG